MRKRVTPLLLALPFLGRVPPATVHPGSAGLLQNRAPATAARDSTSESPSHRSSGVPFGPWGLRAHLLGSVYNGGVLTGHAPYRQLEEIRSRHGQVVLYLARKKSQGPDGRLNVAAVERFLQTWPDLSPYIKDGTVWGIMVSDDITGKHIWGPDAPYYAQIDSIAKLVQDRWPGVRTIVRAPPTVMSYPWKWVQWSWAQYTNAPRNGEVKAYRLRQSAKADSLGLCLAFGLNVVNGGDGSSGVGSPRRYRMSGAEILKYYSELLPYTPVAFHWEYRPEMDEDPEIRAAMQTVRAWADTMPKPECRYER